MTLQKKRTRPRPFNVNLCGRGAAAIAAACIVASPLRVLACAYVANWGSDTLTVIDTAMDAVAATIPVGTGVEGYAIAVAPSGGTVYLANPSVNTVSVVDTATLTLVATIPVPRPFRIAVASDGSYGIVTSLYSTSVLDLRTNVITATLPVKGWEAALSPDGRLAYVVAAADELEGLGVIVIDTAAATVVATIPVGGSGRQIVLSPDGTRAYVATQDGFAVIDTATNMLQTMTRGLPFGDYPSDIALTPDGAFAYVSVEPSRVIVIDTASQQVSAIVPTGQSERVVISADGTRAYVLVWGVDEDRGVLVIDTATHEIINRVPVSGFDIAVDRNGARIYVATGAGLLVADTPSGAVITRLRPARPTDLVVTPDGTWAYVISTGLDQVLAVDLVARRVRAAVPVPSSPQDIALSPDGTLAYVTGRAADSSGSVSVLATGSDSIIASVAVESPAAVAFAPDGGTAYVTTPAGLVLIDVGTAAVRSTVPLPAAKNPRQLALSPDGALAYVTADAGVVAIDTAAGAITTQLSFSSPCYPSMSYMDGSASIVLSPDGAHLYVAMRVRQEVGHLVTTIVPVFAIDTATNMISQPFDIMLPNESFPLPLLNGLGITADGTRLYASTAFSVRVVDTTTRGVVATIPVGVRAMGIAVTEGTCALSGPRSQHRPLRLQHRPRWQQRTPPGVRRRSRQPSLREVLHPHNLASYSAP
jgi:YVTN family beta-propeller protein